MLGGVVAARSMSKAQRTEVLTSALRSVLDAIEDHDDPALDELVDGSCEDHCAEFSEWEEGSKAQLHWTQMCTGEIFHTA